MRKRASELLCILFARCQVNEVESITCACFGGAKRRHLYINKHTSHSHRGKTTSKLGLKIFKLSLKCYTLAFLHYRNEVAYCQNK